MSELSCREIRRRLDLFLDDQLNLNENMQVLKHLNLCSNCSAVYEGEKELRSLLKETRTPAPPEIRDRILHLLRPRWATRILGPAAALALAAGGLLLLRPLEAQPLDRLFSSLTAVSARVPEGKCIGCCGEEGGCRYLTQKTGYAPCLHALSPLELKWSLASVRADVVPGKLVCFNLYEREASAAKVNHLSFPLSYAPFMEEVFSGRRDLRWTAGDQTILATRCGKMICFFLTDRAEMTDQLETLLAAR